MFTDTLATAVAVPDPPHIVTLIITGILSGGFAAAIATLVTSRAAARKVDTEAKAIDAKLPAEVDSVVVQGAEAAVLTMRSALESATSRINELEEDRTADRQRIAELEGKVRELEAKVRRAETALTEARDAGRELRRELAEFARDREHRTR